MLWILTVVGRKVPSSFIDIVRYGVYLIVVQVRNRLRIRSPSSSESRTKPHWPGNAATRLISAIWSHAKSITISVETPVCKIFRPVDGYYIIWIAVIMMPTVIPGCTAQKNAEKDERQDTANKIWFSQLLRHPVGTSAIGMMRFWWHKPGFIRSSLQGVAGCGVLATPAKSPWGSNILYCISSLYIGNSRWWYTPKGKHIEYSVERSKSTSRAICLHFIETQRRP